MPDDRLARARGSLPEGYQFGEARPAVESLEGATLMIDGVLHVVGPAWRPPHANAAEQLQRATHVHDFIRFDPATADHLCRCGARKSQLSWRARTVQLDAVIGLPDHWNVIEGDH